MSKPWTRVQDWISLAAGAYLALSPLWVEVDIRATWALVIIGAAVGVMAVIALAVPGAYIDEWMMAVGGVAAFVAPWVLSYTEITAAAWGSWVAGAIVVVAALAAIPASRAEYQDTHHSGMSTA